jgi:hypothetical protein
MTQSKISKVSAIIVLSFDKWRMFIVVKMPIFKSSTIRTPPLRHDFINFKVMSGNEILLNMENSEFLRDGELINALIELGRRDGQENHDWEVHPYTKIALVEVKKRIGSFNSKHLSQAAYALNKLNINNLEYWESISSHTHRLAHTFDAASIANFFDVFVPKPSEDLQDDVVYLDKEIEKHQKSKRCSDQVLNQLIKVLYLEVKNLSTTDLIRVCEGCSQRNLGDQSLYKEYLFFYIERRVKNFTIDQFVRILKVLGDRQYTEDSIFWNDYMFPRIYKSPLNQNDATLVWDSLLALQVKCPELNLAIPLNYVESLLKKFELIEGFADLDPAVKDTITHVGTLPEGVQTKVRTHSILNQSDKLLEQAQQEVEDEEREKAKAMRLNDPEIIRKRELREQRRIRKEMRGQANDEILYDSD